MITFTPPPAITWEISRKGTASPKSVTIGGFVTNRHRTFAPRYLQTDPEAAAWDFFYQLNEMFHDSSYFDEECLIPSDRALGRMFELLSEAPFLPRGVVYPDGDGGLRLEWVQGNKQLSLAIHLSDPLRDYLYHQEGVGEIARYAVVPLTDDLSAFTNWLPWLLLPSADDATVPAS